MYPYGNSGRQRVNMRIFSSQIHTTKRTGLSSVLRLRQHSIGYMADGF